MGLWRSHDGSDDGCHEVCQDGKYERADCAVEQFARRTEHVKAFGVLDRELRPNRCRPASNVVRYLTESVDLAS